jgi:hypothetical protein
MFLQHGAKKVNEIRMVAPTGFEPVFESRSRFRQFDPTVAPQQRRNKGTRLKHADRNSRAASESVNGAIPKKPGLLRHTVTYSSSTWELTSQRNVRLRTRVLLSPDVSLCALPTTPPPRASSTVTPLFSVDRRSRLDKRLRLIHLIHNATAELHTHHEHDLGQVSING